MPKFASNVSPFTPRVRPGRRQEEFGAKPEANPNVSGKDSTSSTTSTGSEGSTSGSDGSDIDGNLDKDDSTGMQRDNSVFQLVSLKVNF